MGDLDTNPGLDGFYVLPGAAILEYFQRAYEGQDPNVLLLELWAESLRMEEWRKMIEEAEKEQRGREGEGR